MNTVGAMLQGSHLSAVLDVDDELQFDVGSDSDVVRAGAACCVLVSEKPRSDNQPVCVCVCVCVRVLTLENRRKPNCSCQYPSGFFDWR